MLANLWIKMKRISPLHTTIKYFIEFACELSPPLRRIFYNLGTSPNGLDFGTGDMAKDWDSRSRRNAKWYIYWDAWQTEEEFNASGEREVEEVLLKDILLNSEARILEIGCGLGRLLKPLSGRAKGVYGVDISKEMILQGRERLQSHQNIFLSVCDGTLSTFTDNYFDLCYSLAVFRHIPEKKYIYLYLSEASRVLKPGGVLKFEVWGAGPLKSRNKGGTLVGVSFKEQEMRTKLKEYGFEVLTVEKRPKLPYIIYTVIRNAKDGVEPTKALTWIGSPPENSNPSV